MNLNFISTKRFEKMTMIQWWRKTGNMLQWSSIDCALLFLHSSQQSLQLPYSCPLHTSSFRSRLKMVVIGFITKSICCSSKSSRKFSSESLRFHFSSYFRNVEEKKKVQQFLCVYFLVVERNNLVQHKYDNLVLFYQHKFHSLFLVGHNHTPACTSYPVKERNNFQPN